jgi:hypothetical protein
MKKLLGGLVVLTSLLVGTMAFMGTPAQATTCVHNISWFKQDPSRIGGPDLTPSLEAAVLAKTGKASLASVLSSNSFTLDTLAAKAIIVAASNGAAGPAGFEGKLGEAFYKLAHYFEGTESHSKFEILIYTFVLELYNHGYFGLPRC